MEGSLVTIRRSLCALIGAVSISGISMAQTPTAGAPPQPPKPPQPPTPPAVSAAQAPTGGAVQSGPIIVAPAGEEGWVKAGGTIVADSAEPNPYEGNLSERLRLTGDWGGARTNLKECRGVTVDLYSTQFYQGVVAGGRDEDWNYGHKLDYLLNVDGGKLGLKGAFLYLHGETRFGESVNGIDGLLLPSNLPLAFPKPEGTETALTAFKYTQALSESFAVFGGKINTLDEFPMKYSPGIGNNLPGLAGFMNTSLVFNPIMARTIPYATTAFGASVLRDGKPFLTVMALDPEDRSTRGFEDSYARGVVTNVDLQLRTCFMDRPGVINVGGIYSNADYRAIDPAAYLNNLPLLQLQGQVAAPEESGSWALYLNHYQALWVDHCDHDRTWGLFGMWGISDGNPNPIKFVANIGLGGHSPIRCRKYDTFGLGFFYTGLSDEFKDLAAPVLAQHDEYGVEGFYNYAIRPWCRLTGDLQVARPSTQGIDTTVILGTRLQILF